MITPRYHLLSLAAVFLALAVGVVLGSGVLSEPLASGLRAERTGLNERIEAMRQQEARLSEKLAAANEFDTQVSGRIVHGELAEKSVIVVRAPDAVDDDVAAISRLVGQAGGIVTGTVTMTQQFVEANETEKLRSVIDSTVLPAGAKLDATLVDQVTQAGNLLGSAMLINRDPAVPPAEEAERDLVLAALRDTGFLTYAPNGGGDHQQRLGPANAAIVVTGGDLGDAAGNRGVSMARLAAGLAPYGSGTVMAGRDGCASGTAAVAVARSDGAVSTVVSTVDDLETEAGRITTVMAVADLIRGGRTGQYGIGDGAGTLTLAQ